MKRLLYPVSLAVMLVSPLLSVSQNFSNGALNGTIGISTTPTGWAQVPFGDPVSQSTMTLSATSDVTGTTGPMTGVINGNPYEGTTYVSGLHHTSGSDTWHEGLQQTVSGLTIGAAYTISFWQMVTKQSNALDNSGTWTVYKENTLIGQSAATIDNAPYGTNGHVWQRRTLTFTATATSHLFKFLPRDDDGNWVDPNSVRMGIDSINLRPAVILPSSIDFDLSLLDDQSVQLAWDDPEAAALSYYIVEHSPDGLRFEPIGSVEIGGGSQFSFVDEKPFLESYYRVAMVNEDGGKSYTEVKHIASRAPVHADLYGRLLEVSGGYGGTYQILLLDLQGRKIYEERGPDRADFNGFPAGAYFLRVTSEGPENAILEKKIWLQ